MKILFFRNPHGWVGGDKAKEEGVLVKEESSDDGLLRQ